MLYLWDENSEQAENCAVYLINSASIKGPERTSI